MISVIVPVYNVSKYLRKCIDSIIHQTYKDLEIILVDDGSTDGSSEICDEYLDKDTRIIVIHKENGGLSSARNRGLEIAKGDYISFIDSDDWIEKNFFTNMSLGILERADVINGDYSIEYNGKVYPKYDDLGQGLYKGKDLLSNFLTPLIISGRHMPVWTNLYSLKFLKEHNCYFASEREVYAEDMVFNTLVYSTCTSVYKVTNPSYIHLIIKGSLSQSYRPGLYQMGLKRLALISDYLTEHWGDKYSSIITQNRANLVASCLYKESLCTYETAIANIKTICETNDVFPRKELEAKGRYTFLYRLGKLRCYHLIVICAKLLSLCEPIYRYVTIKYK